MMQTMDCGEARISLGVYVLGAIDPAERSMVDAHLATCRDCRDELAGLAGLPALLARVDAAEAIALAAADGPPGAEEADQAAASGRAGSGRAGAGRAGSGSESPQPSRELLATVIDLTAARRRRRRWRDASLSLAAALVIAAGVFGGIRLGAGPSSAGGALADPHYNVGPVNGPWQSIAGSLHGMTATVAYRSTGWGTQLAVKVNGIPMATSCELWIIGKDGSKTLAGGWVTDQNEGSVWYPVSAGMSAIAMRGFQVTVGASHPQTITVNV
jgi:hypothetical protein